jgi:hypothetical protein
MGARSTSLPKPLFATTALGLLVLLAACSPRVPKPTSDGTPPTLQWVITDEDTNEQQTFSGSGSIQTTQGKSYQVVLKAIDPQGIFRITISSSFGYSCSGGGIGQQVGPSLGAVRTLVVHAASVTHTQLTREEREARGITDGLVRVSVGIEDPEDLLEDFERALEKA